MSAIYVYRIKRSGRLAEIGEAPDSRGFLIAIWHHLMLKHGILPRGAGPSFDLPKLGELWMRVAQLPRVDGLLCAATFDRAWFPLPMLAELCAALETATFAPTCAPIAKLLRAYPWTAHQRGVCFGSSLNNAWFCYGADDDADYGGHIVGKGGHKCKSCHKPLQNADHMLRDKACCRETDDPNAYRDDTLDGVD